MIIRQQKDGSIISIDPLSGKSITITFSEIQDFKTPRKDNYLEEWRSSIRDSLVPFALTEFSICLIISGRFDHRKGALKEHLKRVNREDYLEEIWKLL